MALNGEVLGLTHATSKPFHKNLMLFSDGALNKSITFRRTIVLTRAEACLKVLAWRRKNDLSVFPVCPQNHFFLGLNKNSYRRGRISN